MGTRGNIILKFRGKKITLYDHYDSYPSGLGKQLIADLLHLLSKYTVEELQEMLNKCKIVSEDLLPGREDVEKLSKYTNLEVSRQSTNDWYCLVHKCQGKLKRIIKSGYLYDTDVDAAYTYILDFEEETFTCKETGDVIPFSSLSLTYEFSS